MAVYTAVSAGTGNIPFQTVTVNTIMIANNGYFVDSAGPVTMTLPPNFAEGDIIIVAGINTGLWTVKTTAPQTILIGQQGATSAGGTLVATNGHDSVDLIGCVANTTLTANNIEGNLTFT